MKKIDRLVTALALLLASTPLLADEWTLTAAEWSRPRSGERVRAMEPVNAAVNAWRAAGDDAQLILRHASGEEGSLWAAELKDWLVALGVPAHRIEVVPAGMAADRLELEVEES